jgi:hypothetical protein
MDDERNGTHRPTDPDPSRSGHRPDIEHRSESSRSSRAWKVDEIHRQGWMAYALGLALLLTLLLVAGRVLSRFMAGYAETAVSLPEEP